MRFCWGGEKIETNEQERIQDAVRKIREQMPPPTELHMSCCNTATG